MELEIILLNERERSNSKSQRSCFCSYVESRPKMMMMMMGHEYKIGTTGEITRRRGKEEE
jgi:hypothetical protein